jgi:hypothetical protein
MLISLGDAAFRFVHPLELRHLAPPRPGLHRHHPRHFDITSALGRGSYEAQCASRLSKLCFAISACQKQQLKIVAHRGRSVRLGPLCRFQIIHLGPPADMAVGQQVRGWDSGSYCSLLYDSDTEIS